MSQKNYITSKAGNTVEDYLEDGVTPTPRGRKEEATELRTVIELSDKSNRQALFSRLDEAFMMGDHSGEVEGLFEEISRVLFEILKEGEEQSVKEQSLVFLKKIFQLHPSLVESSLE